MYLKCLHIINQKQKTILNIVKKQPKISSFMIFKKSKKCILKKVVFCKSLYVRCRYVGECTITKRRYFKYLILLFKKIK